MSIVEATNLIYTLDVEQRSHYSFQRLSTQVFVWECNEPLVEPIRILREPYWDTTGETEGDCYHAYIQQHPGFGLQVRAEVYARLQLAQTRLPQGWVFVLKAGYRPYEVQQAVLESFVARSRHEHPAWTDSQHLVHARTFVSDPLVLSPPHVTGGAVDVLVRDMATCHDVDMGCPPNTDEAIAHLHSLLVTGKQHENRMVLLHAMLAAGFAPHASEWWHYQYGESYWAAFYGRKIAHYSSIR